MTETNCELVEAKFPEEWKYLHELRRSELFKPKHTPYNPDHPANYASGRFTLLLKFNGKYIGTASLDVLGDGNGVIRVVAITKEEQGKGHGRILEEKFEAFAYKKGITKLFVNANKEAVEFYKKLGYVFESWDDSANTLTDDSVQMSKVLAVK